MADIRLIGVNTPDIITFDWLQTPVGLLDETMELATAVIVALNTDALADPPEKLPDPRSTDRRGWWGDLDAATIWQGWNIGSKLWLLHRAKLVGPEAAEGATIARANAYIAQCLQPFIDNKIFTSFTTDLTIVNERRIDGQVLIYRGTLDAIQLNFQPLWETAFPINEMW